MSFGGNSSRHDLENINFDCHTIANMTTFMTTWQWNAQTILIFLNSTWSVLNLQDWFQFPIANCRSCFREGIIPFPHPEHPENWAKKTAYGCIGTHSEDIFKRPCISYIVIYLLIEDSSSKSYMGYPWIHGPKQRTGWRKTFCSATWAVGGHLCKKVALEDLTTCYE